MKKGSFSKRGNIISKKDFVKRLMGDDASLRVFLADPEKELSKEGVKLNSAQLSKVKKLIVEYKQQSGDKQKTVALLENISKIVHDGAIGTTRKVS